MSQKHIGMLSDVEQISLVVAAATPPPPHQRYSHLL